MNEIFTEETRHWCFVAKPGVAVGAAVTPPTLTGTEGVIQAAVFIITGTYWGVETITAFSFNFHFD